MGRDGIPSARRRRQNSRAAAIHAAGGSSDMSVGEIEMSPEFGLKFRAMDHKAVGCRVVACGDGWGTPEIRLVRDSAPCVKLFRMTYCIPRTAERTCARSVFDSFPLVRCVFDPGAFASGMLKDG